MESNRRVSRFLLALGAAAAGVCVAAAVACRSWSPVAAFLGVLLSLVAMDLVLAVAFAPLLSLVARLAGSRGHRRSG